jgi:hypothetical protein
MSSLICVICLSNLASTTSITEMPNAPCAYRPISQSHKVDTARRPFRHLMRVAHAAISNRRSPALL